MIEELLVRLNEIASHYASLNPEEDFARFTELSEPRSEEQLAALRDETRREISFDLPEIRLLNEVLSSHVRETVDELELANGNNSTDMEMSELAARAIMCATMLIRAHEAFVASLEDAESFIADGEG